MSSPRILLAAFAAVFIVPAAAHASTVELQADGTLSVRAAAGESNNIHVKPEGVPGVRVRDFGAPLSTRGRGLLGDANDLYVGQHGFATVADGGAGTDFYGAGAGADTIFAADGERDTVDCGTNPAGLFDAAPVDARETAVRNCESSSVEAVR